MKITLLSKPGFSGNMLVRKIEEGGKSRLMDIEVFLNEHLQEADVVLLTPQRCEDLKEIKKVVKVPVGATRKSTPAVSTVRMAVMNGPMT